MSGIPHTFPVSFPLGRQLPLSTDSPLGQGTQKISRLMMRTICPEWLVPSSCLIQNRLVSACRAGDVQSIRYFLSKYKYSPIALNISLLEATKGGRNEVLSELLTHKVVSREVILLGLENAIAYNQLETFKIWISMLEPDDLDLKELLIRFSNWGDRDFFNVILEKGSFFSITLKEAASVAICYGNLNILNAIIKNDLPINYIGELFIEASIQNKLGMVTILGEKKIPERYLAKAFIESVSYNNLDVVKYILSLGIDAPVIKEGLCRSISIGCLDVALFLLEMHFEGDEIDEALLIACERGHMEIVLKILELHPTSLALFGGLQVATIEGHLDIFTHLLTYVEFSIDSLIEIWEIASNYDQGEILQFLEHYIFSNFPEILDSTQSWRIDLNDVREDPSAVLDTWLEIEKKPLEIIFNGQNGYGEGLTRQFYAELSQSLFKRILDEKGIPFTDNPHNIDLEGVAILLSFIFQNNLKTGKLFSESFRRILLLAHDPKIFPSLAVEEIHYLTDLDRCPIQDYAWAFVVDPDDKKTKKRWLNIFGQEPDYRGIQDATLKEQIQATEKYLVTKYHKNILKEFLHLVRTQSPMIQKSRDLVYRIAKEFYFEDLKTLQQLIEFAEEWEKGAHKDATKLYHIAKLFLKGLSPSIIQMLYHNNLEPLEGIPLLALKRLNLEYLGQDRAILEKIALIQRVVGQKIDSKDTKWIEKLLFFITGSFAHPEDLVIGVTELKEESFPEARTCFKQLRLSIGYDTKPIEVEDWQSRFLSKLEFAMSETGYQRD